MEADISILRKTGHFYFALTGQNQWWVSLSFDPFNPQSARDGVEKSTDRKSLCGNSLFVSGHGFNRAVTAAKSTRL